MLGGRISTNSVEKINFCSATLQCWSSSSGSTGPLASSA